MGNKIIFRIFIAILSILESKKYKTKYIVYTILFIFIFNNYKRLYRYTKFNLKEIILAIIMGYIIGIIITSLSSWFFYGRKINISMGCLNIHETLIIVEEELFWRSFMYEMINTIDKSLVLIYICIISLTFVLAHKINSILDLLEMYLYTVLISFSYLFLPGFNIGLHLSRNALLNYDSEDRKDGNRKDKI